MSTFKANEVLLTELLGNIEKGTIQLPDFQRGWVWDEERIKDLLVSISRGFPIGAVMTLEAGGEVKFESKAIEGVTLNGKVAPGAYLLDGQQRLTSLYQALRHRRPVETRGRPGSRRTFRRWYYINMQEAMDSSADRDKTVFSVPEDRVVRSNFGRKEELDLSSPELEYKLHMIPTEKVLDSLEWSLGYINYWEKRDDHPCGSAAAFFKSFNEVVLKSFSEYQVPVISLGKGTGKEAVCTVFEKVNTGGVVLTVFELVTASFAADDFRLRDDWSQRKNRMHSAFGVLQDVTGDRFLQAVALLVTQERRRKAEAASTPLNPLPGIDCRRGSILELKLNEYKQWADAVEAGFIEAAQFLNRQSIYTGNNVPYNTQLVPLAALYAELGKELKPANAQEKLERWFWCGVLGEMYGSAVETQFANDLAQVARFVREEVEPDLLTRANFDPGRLLSLRTRLSAAYKGLYALQMKCGAADWHSGESLGFADIHNKSIDIHHIFPRHWCAEVAKPPIRRDIVESIINKTPIDSYTNQKLGGAAPSKYLPSLRKDIKEGKLDGILKAHWIDPDKLEKDDFSQFFVERGQAMFDLINRTMGKPVTDARSVFRDALGDGISDADQGDDEVEHDPVGERTYVGPGPVEGVA